MKKDEPMIPIKLNNQGANLLLGHRYEPALRTFTQALKLVKILLRNKQVHRRSSYEDCSNPIEIEQASNFGQRWVTERHNAFDAHISTKGFVFRDPIVVKNGAIVGGRRSLLRVTVIIMFNLGLTRHLLALDRRSMPSKQRSDLSKALALYELSVKVQTAENIEISDIYNMALLNNLGHVHATNNNLKKSRRCFKNLLDYLICYTECIEKSGAKRDVLDGFFQNTVPLMLHDPALAPAA